MGLTRGWATVPIALPCISTAATNLNAMCQAGMGARRGASVHQPRACPSPLHCTGACHALIQPHSAHSPSIHPRPQSPPCRKREAAGQPRRVRYLHDKAESSVLATHSVDLLTFQVRHALVAHHRLSPQGARVCGHTECSSTGEASSTDRWEGQGLALVQGTPPAAHSASVHVQSHGGGCNGKGYKGYK